ncbi:flippase activity-associated protein Agl23 [Halomarina litorea]|uniref:flippase activity-associated protein Agl23 n=1 Tax=Halomarina litorea TaxID=2961595 RepID=UPI0020C24DD4|nr:flippase activity-associated protein Agl23 [Halomarina sp. BCD28]
MTADRPDRLRATLAVVGAIALLALLARFLFLGHRVAHWDEGRVGYWILDFMRTGEFSYRPIIHGPFLQHVNRAVFSVFGATDATMRYVPALAGGLLPLTALLFRDRLDRVEVAALAFFLAANPILLYYSRFMRGDPLVGAFMFAGFAFLIRLLDTRNLRHLFAAVGFVALGFTVKENAPVYVVCWLGAAAVVGYLKVVVARAHGEYPLTGLRARLRGTSVQRGGHDWSSAPQANGGASPTVTPRTVLLAAGVLLLAVVEFFAIIVFFYAPRGTAKSGLELVEAATVGSFNEFYSLWGDGGMSEHAYLPYLGDLLQTLGAGAVVLCLFALLGFALESYREGGPRPLVFGAFAWGVASLLGYPIITDIKAPWAAVHVVLPLAIPAAAGVSHLVTGGWARYRSADDAMATVGALALALAVVSAGFVGFTGYQTVYANPASPDNELVQYAQPSGDLHGTIAAMEALADRNEGTDVVLYGTFLVQGDPIRQQPSCAGSDGWFNSLPLPWYLERSDAEVACAYNTSALSLVEEEGDPPVVITTLESRSLIAERYPNYDVVVQKLRTTDTRVAFFYDPSRLPADFDTSHIPTATPVPRNTTGNGSENGTTTAALRSG